jgi:hypothetical protein
MSKHRFLLCLAALWMAAPVEAGPYAQLSSTETQAGGVTPKRVTMNSDDALKCIGHDKGVVTIKDEGAYFVMAAAQVGATSSAKGAVRLWLRVNGKDVDNSNTEQTIVPGFTAVLVCQGVSEFKAGDKVEMYFSASKEGLALIASTPKGEPVIPSIIFSAFKLEGGPYAQLSSTETQAATSSPSLITLNSVDAAKGVEHDKGTITVKEEGVYFVMAAGQAGAPKGTGKGAVKLWMRLNGKDIDNSNTEQSLAGAFSGVLVCQGIAECKAGDKLQLMQSASGAGVGMVASSPKGEPVIPSMIFSIFKVKSGPYAQLSSTETQPAATTPKEITLNSVDAAKDVDNAKGTLTVKQGGCYFVIGAGQVGSVKGAAKGSVKLWMALGGKGIDNSNTEQSIGGGYTAVLVCQGLAELKGGERLNLLQSATGPGLGMIASTPRGEPVIPSMIFSLFKVD